MTLVTPQAKYIGDYKGGNYLEIKSDGEVNLHGTARVKKCVHFEGEQLAVGSTPPDSNTVGNYLYFQYDIGDDSKINMPMPFDWVVGTDLMVAIRWGINEAYATANGEVQWRVNWSAVPNDGSEAIDSPTHSGQVDSGDINIPATAKTIQQTEITIPGTNIIANDEFGIKLSRIALVGGVNPTADPGIICVGVVYTADKLGAATQEASWLRRVFRKEMEAVKENVPTVVVVVVSPQREKVVEGGGNGQDLDAMQLF